MEAWATEKTLPHYATTNSNNKDFGILHIFFLFEHLSFCPTEFYPKETPHTKSPCILFCNNKTSTKIILLSKH